MKKFFVILIAIAIMSVPFVAQAEINVPEDYLSIQEAVNAANFGDTIMVAPGTYDENLVISDKEVFLIGSSNYETVVDGGNIDTAVSVINSEIYIEDFVFTHGLGNVSNLVDAGGIYCENSNAEFVHVIVDENAGLIASGVGIINSNVSFFLGSVSNNNGVNTTIGGSGISIRGDQSSLLLDQVEIYNNEAAYGGGIYCHLGASLDIANCQIMNNEAIVGGGIRLFGASNTTIVNTNIMTNIAHSQGAGIWSCDNNDNNYLDIINCQITGNEILGNDDNNNNGGGIYSDNSDILISSTQITDNEAEGNDSGGGGGIYLRNGSSCEIENSEISDNIALLTGGGITVMSNSNVEISDTIIHNNLVSGTSNYDPKGGGIAAFINGDVNLNNVQVTNNNAFNGGGIYGASTSDIHMTKCLFAGNIGAYGGSMYYDWPSKVEIMNLTVTNDPSTHAIFVQDTEFIMLNSIIWSNVSFPIYATEEASLMIDYSNIVGGEDAIMLNEDSELIWGNHNIEQDPLFNSDYTLQEDSPCIDAGIDQFTWNGVDYMVEEWNGLAPDMGCYESEYTPGVNIYESMHNLYASPWVNPTFDPANPGVVWDDIFVYPGLNFWNMNSTDVIENNYVENSITGIGFEINLSDNLMVNNFCFPEENWLQTIGVLNWPGEGSMSWVADPGEEINGTALIFSYIINNLIVGENGWINLDLFLYNNCNGEFVSEYLFRSINIHCVQAMRGDVDGDGDVDIDDVIMSMQMMSIGGGYDPTMLYQPEGQPCLSRQYVLFTFPNMFNTYLINVAIVDPNHPLIALLNIGGYFDGTWPAVAETQWEFINVNTIEINPLEANCIGISGNMPDGTIWSEVYFLEEDVTRCWTATSSIEGEVVQINRNGFEVEIPEGLQNLSVEGKLLSNTTSTEPENIPKLNTQLLGNYPNPFNPETTIPFSLSEEGMVKISIYNIKGQLIETLANENFSSGEHNVIWNAENVPSGVYFCKMTSQTGTLTNKMILMK